MKSVLLFSVLMGVIAQIGGDAVGAGKGEAGKVATRAVGKGAATTRAVGGKGAEVAALERKLVREWRGPDCGGDFKFKADGSFVCDSYTPAGCTLTGRWEVRWGKLPPSLLLTFETSDFKKKDPGWPEFKYLGKTLEVRILELDDEVLVFKGGKGEWDWRGWKREEE